uniref:DNA-3-methyladenine glycosylase 1 n=1 Tax=Arundo donax TaxID=35708 RepID=A0A0A9G1R1_ARUDO
MAALCERWRPYRSVGAWYMWWLMERKGAAAKKKKGNASSYLGMSYHVLLSEAVKFR